MKTCPILIATLLLGAGVPLGLATLRAHEPTAAGAAPTAAAENYDIDSVHTTMVFRVQHLGVSYFFGRFNDISGKFTWDAAKPETSSIEVTIKTESIDTNSKDRDNHLRSADFFDAKQFPTMTFKSTKVEKAGEHGLKVTGDLTLHGVKKSITVDVTHVGSGESGFGYSTGFETKFSFKRSDHGMDNMLDKLGDEVTVALGLEGVRK